MSSGETSNAAGRDGPEGIGGWLILPVIGIVLTPIQGLFQVSQYLVLADSFEYLSAGQNAFVAAELIGNLTIVVILPIVLLVLLYRRRATFPRLYIIWAIPNLVFILGDLAAAKILFGDLFEASGTPLIDAATAQALVRAVVLVVIWIPYMLNSRRIRNTFVQ